MWITRARAPNAERRARPVPVSHRHQLRDGSRWSCRARWSPRRHQLEMRLPAGLDPAPKWGPHGGCQVYHMVRATSADVHAAVISGGRLDLGVGPVSVTSAFAELAQRRVVANKSQQQIAHASICQGNRCRSPHCVAVPINPTETWQENLNENMVAFLRSYRT